MEKNTIIIISILSAIVLFTAVFCSIWYTVPVDVNTKIEKIISNTDTFTTSKLGVGYEISSEELAQIFSEELKNVRFTNSSGIVETIYYLRDSISLRYGNNNTKYIKIDDDKIFIGAMCYRADTELESRLSQRIFEKAQIILD